MTYKSWIEKRLLSISVQKSHGFLYNRANKRTISNRYRSWKSKDHKTESARTGRGRKSKGSR